MKNLEQTKRIPIVFMLFLLAIIIALFVYKRPNYLFKEKTANNLEELINNNDYIIILNNIYHPDIVLIDTRDALEFEEAHLENAINIPSSAILDKANIEIFDKLESEHKTAVLYGNTPNEVTGPFMVLYQLGYNNVKILATENTNINNTLFAKRVEIEKAENDVNAFIAASVEIANKSLIEKVVVKKPAPPKPKKVVPVKKKKKMPMEGGC